MSEESQVQEQSGEQAEQAQAAEQARLAEESRARDSGWRPKEEFKGDPSKFKDAATWNKFADDYMPFAKIERQRLMQELGATKSELSALRKTMQQVVAVNETITQREYNRALETLRKEQKAAIAEGNGDRWAELEQDKDKLQANKPEKITIPADTGPELFERNKTSFLQRNSSWYGEDKDPDMTGYAILVGDRLSSQGVDPSMQFQMVEDEVKRKFPHKFGNPRRNETSVDGGSGIPGKPSAAKKNDYNSLPMDAKEACNKHVRDITTRYPARKADVVRSEWLKIYHSEE